MTHAIAMCGNDTSLRLLRDAFWDMEIDLENKDYADAEDILEALEENPGISAVLIVELAADHLNGGKYNLIKSIRAVDKTVRILFCASKNKKDNTFEAWCKKYGCIDFVYPKKKGVYDPVPMSGIIKKGRGQGQRKKAVKQASEPPAEVEKTTQVVPVIVVETLLDEPVIPTFDDFEDVGKQIPVPVAEMPQPQPEPIQATIPEETKPEIPLILPHITQSGRSLTVAVYNLAHGAGATAMAYGLSEAVCDAGEYAVIIPADGKADLNKVECEAALVTPFHSDETAHLIRQMSEGRNGIVVVDFGNVFSIQSDTLKQELDNCDFHIVMAFSAPWHRENLSRFLHQNQHGKTVIVVDGELDHPLSEVFIYTREQAAPELLAREIIKFTEDSR